MTGLPGETEETRIANALLCARLELDMVGIGPFIPHPGTPLAGARQETIELTLRMTSLARLLMPEAHLPATTAAGSLDPQGREKMILAGANVLMPNMTPSPVRKNYLLYPGRSASTRRARSAWDALPSHEIGGSRAVLRAGAIRGDRASRPTMEPDAGASPKVYYGEETRKALANFGPGETPPALIAAYAKVKRAAVAAVQEVESRFDPGLFACLLDALDEIARGKHDRQFPLSIRQGGAGTSFNMNLNEVAPRGRGAFRERRGGRRLGSTPSRT